MSFTQLTSHFARAPKAAGFLFLAGACCVVPASAAAQQVTPEPEVECLTELTSEEIALHTLMNERLESVDPIWLDSTSVVALTFHVVRTSSGTGGLSQSRLDQALADANAEFAPAGMEFCVPGPIDYIDNDFFNTQMTSTTHYNQLRSMNVVPGTINIYFVESFGFCGLSSFTTSPVQGIIMQNNCTATSTNHSTFPHEIGHYFNLYHTHETFFGVECPSGSNCGSAGDLVCDTPADPQVFGQVNSSCMWTGSGSACGQPYNPDVTNIMSYSSKQCRDNFTTGQHTRAFSTLVSLRTELDLTLCDTSCYADCDGNGSLNILDYICFGDDFAAGGSYADCDGNGSLNILDYICFGDVFAAGCP